MLKERKSMNEYKVRYCTIHFTYYLLNYDPWAQVTSRQTVPWAEQTETSEPWKHLLLFKANERSYVVTRTVKRQMTLLRISSFFQHQNEWIDLPYIQKYKRQRKKVSLSVNPIIPTPFFPFLATCCIIPVKYNKTKKASDTNENKMTQNILQTFFVKTNKEKRASATSFCLVFVES